MKMRDLQQIPQLPRSRQMFFALVIFFLILSLCVHFGSLAFGHQQLADTKIAFVSGRDGNWELLGNGAGTSIYVINADGTHLTRLTNHPGFNTHLVYDASPAWSPDGQKIVFSSNHDGKLNKEIYVINADETHLQRLTPLILVSRTSIQLGPLTEL